MDEAISKSDRRYRIVRAMEEGRASAEKIGARYGMTAEEVEKLVTEATVKRERRTATERSIRFSAADNQFARLMAALPPGKGF